MLVRRTAIYLLLVILPSIASCQTQEQFDFPESAAATPETIRPAMQQLARSLLSNSDTDQGGVGDKDRLAALDNRFRQEIVAADYAAALVTLSRWRATIAVVHPERAGWMNLQYDIYARAKARAQAGNTSFAPAYQEAFRDQLGKMSDRDSALLIRALDAGAGRFAGAQKRDLAQQKGKNTILATDAVTLVHDYQAAEAYREFSPLRDALIAEDDARRYIIEKNVLVKTPDGASLCTMIVRPKNAGKLPALFEFTIYADESSMNIRERPAASHGYAAVIGLVRGKGCSPDPYPVVYEKDGDDATALIDWISKQPWSDGRVGMYGGSYSGGTAWAAAKHMPAALKAIMVGAPVAPGIDVPMEGNVFWNFVYPWPFYTTTEKEANDKVYGDSARWQKLNHDWYVSGRPYRDLEKIDGTPNPVFDTWISHPNYDAYWQRLIPYRKDFARIHIPVLQTVGYYFGGPGAAGYYASQHYKYDPKAEHYLVIGPYHHFGAQVGTMGLLGDDFDSIAGYKLDPVAMIDFDELRYQWFDHIFKGQPKPALLADKINYQVTGANVWKHSPTLQGMASTSMRLYISAEKDGTSNRLTEKPAAESFVPQKIDFKDRSDVDRQSVGGGVQDKALDTWNGIEFLSAPLTTPTELSGLFAGHLEFTCNKKDFDFEIDLYEQTAGGEYIQLAPYWSRASYVGDLEHRHLLTPGKRQRVDFRAVRLMSHQLAAGSRIVAVLTVIKDPGRQINYGTGKEVSDESVADASTPLEIKWYGNSYLELPVGKP